MGQLADLLSQLDARPGIRGRQFERLCAWYLRNAPEYRNRIRNVWLWSEWPGAWAADAGIDVVAEDTDGGLWAIQAKAYAEAYAIKKADVDSFLSESSRPQFSYRLLIATTDHLGPTARRTLDAQREPVGYLLRSQLELAQVAWPSSFHDLRPRKPRPKTPFPHVREAIDATVKGFEGQERGQLIMACGTGKTLAAMWISERLDCVRTLVLVPSLSLLAQTLREWAVNASGPFEYLAVCSDPTVVGEDALVERTTELGFPATTDPSTISSFLRRRDRRVVFATYQSSPQVAAAFQRRTPQFDLAIADEAHRCAGPTSSEFATILSADKIKCKRRLFMTATPRFYTPRVRRKAGQLDVDIASMDNEGVFGPVLHRLTFGEAIERDLLSDYQVLVVGVDDEMYRAWAKRGEFVSTDGKKVTDARSLAGQIAVAKSMHKYDLRRTISFHSRVNAAGQFSAEMPGVIRWLPMHVRPTGSIWSQHVSGAMASGQRDRLLLRFRNLAESERGLLSNARCLAEGVDVPSIDSVAFIDPRRSTIDIVQALGRAIRKSGEKPAGTIVLPVFLSADEDPARVLDESTFQHIWDVLKALRAHDETLGEELDGLRRRLGNRRGEPRLPGRIKVDLPRRVGRGFAKAFEVRLVERTTASWEFFFGLLERFVEEEGHSRVPTRYRDADGVRLGQWAAVQREAYKEGDLEDERRNRLEGLAGWTWNRWEDTWEDAFDRLEAYVKHEGDSRVPKNYRDRDGFGLGAWVARQRLDQSGTLDEERSARLAALPGWTWDNRFDEAWEKGFARLQSYVQREGDSRISTSYRDDDRFQLGVWVARQRSMFQRGLLDKRRRARLETLVGWTWDPINDNWEEGFAHLERYVNWKGHSRVPTKYRDNDGFRLGQWVSVQRSGYRTGSLKEERRQRLAELRGWSWKTTDAVWEVGFASLESFVEREGHSRVPQTYCDEDGYRLGSWVAQQRRRYHEGVLQDERRDRLESIGGWAWDPINDAWESGFARLRSYVQREGHSRVPMRYRDSDGFRLGQWVGWLRKGYQEGTLDDERRDRLQALRGWTWNARDDAWETGFARLQRYVEIEGHSRVPKTFQDEDGFPLGLWVSRQRRRHRQGHDEGLHHRLEALPGWTWENRFDEAWEDNFARLQAYVLREGHAEVPGGFRDDDGFTLGQWVSVQRRKYRLGALEPERIGRLETLSGWVWSASSSNGKHQ